MKAIPSGIFKAYDIRGIYPQELDEETALRIGKAIAVFSKAKTVFVGRDVRLSSSSIRDALIKGLTEQGTTVEDIGLCNTPILYFASGTLPCELGIMVTASHNPKEYNGFKICRKGAIPVGGDTGLQQIRELAQKSDFVPAPKKGTVSHRDIMPQYHSFFLKRNPKKFLLKAVVDTANSVGVFEAQVLQKLCTVVPLFFELDGTFPNHLGNPLDYATLKTLQQKVAAEKADLGIAFDGDADRISFVDEKGQILPNDLVTALLARFFPKETILFDVRSTKTIETEIKKAGGKPVRCRVGHAFIKAQMRETNAAFAGELSGHYYYRDLFFAESSLQTALLVLGLLQKEKKPLSELVQGIRKGFQSGEINFTVRDSQAKLKEIEAHYKKKAEKIGHLDGITVEFPDWWCSIRASNTEPLLRLNLEADSGELLEKKVQEVSALITAEKKI